MLFLKCPKPESLLEYVSIPAEISYAKKLFLSSHVFSCKACAQKTAQLREQWMNVLMPEPDITSSLLKVYTRLQQDETLVLKGWKLNTVRGARSHESILFRQGWLFRGAVIAGLGGVVLSVVLGSLLNPREPVSTGTFTRKSGFPFAQIRTSEKDNVRVQYVKPELLQSIDFETTGLSR